MEQQTIKKYIAITIGPIFDTMSLVSTPAALWLSSYMFSCITKMICEALCKERTYGREVPEKERITSIDETKIVTPYYSKTDRDLFDKKDGVGLFHDHIIFEADGWDINKFDLVKKEVLENISGIFEIPLDYLQKYIQIAAVKYEAENPILGCESILNSRELEKPFVAQDSEQPLMKLLFAGKGASNEWIKVIAEKLGIYEKWQLTEGKNIKDMNAIVKNKKGSTLKKHRYYAIVRSDGDNMSKIISSLSNSGEVQKNADGSEVDMSFRSFSKTCLRYCSDIADEVAKFGGVTIYAGGDDLLAILPCENKDGKTPFEFIRSANGIFKRNFEQYNKPTSLSFGITMCYYKFPLYEALDDSAGLLFGVAKDKDRKNCAVIRLQKHAGQSEGLVIPNAALDEFLALKDVIVKPEVTASVNKKEEAEASCGFGDQTADGKTAEKNERVIVSALHKLSLFEPLLQAAKKDAEQEKETLTKKAEEAAKNAYENATEEEKQKAIETAIEKATAEASAKYRKNIVTLFGNIFDAKEQQSDFLLKTLPDFYHKLETSLKIDAVTDKGLQNNSVTDIAYVLRILKFFNEKAGDRK